MSEYPKQKIYAPHADKKLEKPNKTKENDRKKTVGIILAGGQGTRLFPMTLMVNKQFLPVYDKPTIYYPLTSLMLAGIRDIMIICNGHDLSALNNFLKDGSQWNIKINYAVQDQPNGLAEAFLIADKFIGNNNCCLILGDNLYHGQGFSQMLQRAAQNAVGAQIFAYHVADPERFGVVELDDNGQARKIVEKPKNPKSNLAVTGLYFFDNTVVARAKTLKPSARGELEITDLIRLYLDEGQVTTHMLGRGFFWFDVGTPEALAIASQYVQVLEERQNISIGCPEEVALRMGFITKAQLDALVKKMPDNCTYSKYLKDLLKSPEIKNLQVNPEHPNRRAGDFR